MNFEDVRKTLNSQRRMYPREYEFLASLVTKPGYVVDIGAWMGFSTKVLAEALKAKNLPGMVIAIDPHTSKCAGKYAILTQEVGVTSTCDFLLKNLEDWGISDRTIVLPARSQDIGRNLACSDNMRDINISLLVIDGSHRYEDVKEDFEVWYPLVEPQGIIAFHDYKHIPGPTKVVDELVRSRCKEIRCVQRLIAFQK